MERPAILWSIPEQLPKLDAKSAHVWCVPLEMKSERDTDLLAWLSPDEQQRASRYVFPRDRQRFSICRAKLRKILAAYRGERPRQIVFRYGPNGKPALDPNGGLHFNVSHAENRALVAVSRCGPLGV